MVSISIVSCDTYLVKHESLRFDKKECYMISLSEAHICWDSNSTCFLRGRQTSFTYYCPFLLFFVAFVWELGIIRWITTSENNICQF
jgi:hypothetical protein